MMEENKMLDTLFEAARNEAPRLSFQQVREYISTFTAGIGILTIVKMLLAKSGYLKLILMISFSGIVLTSVLIVATTSQTDKEPLQKLPAAVEDSTDALYKDFKSELTLKPKSKIGTAIEVAQPELNLKIPEFQPYEDSNNLRSIGIEENESRSQNSELEELTRMVKATDQNTVNSITIPESAIILNSYSTPSDLENFKQTLKDWGFTVEINWNYKKKKGYIRSFIMKLGHSKGLDVKFKIQGFRNFIIFCERNQNSEPIALKTRIDHNNYNTINLNSTGSYTYKSSK